MRTPPGAFGLLCGRRSSRGAQGGPSHHSLEAFADFSRFTGVEGVDWESAYGTYHALESESYTGNLITNIFAGGTVDTERAF